MSENSKSSKFTRIMKLVLNGIRHLFLHNGWFKLIAVLISVILWAGLISQDETLTRDKTFQNVNVTISGTDTLKRNGYIVTSDMDEVLKNVTVVAAVPQRRYDEAEASAFNIRVEMGRINASGEQELKILSSDNSTYGQVVSISPSFVTVRVEDYFVRQTVPVTVRVTGSTPDGWYMSTPSVDPKYVAVSGPRELVKNITRAIVYVDQDKIEWTEETLLTSAEIRLFNEKGEEVSNPLLGISSESLRIDSVLIEAKILPTKTFRMEDFIQTVGEPEEGYEIKGPARFSPDSVTIAARGEVLEQLEELPAEQRTVNVTGATDSVVVSLKVLKPSEDAAILPKDTVSVTVEIGPVEESD